LKWLLESLIIGHTRTKDKAYNCEKATTIAILVILAPRVWDNAAMWTAAVPGEGDSHSVCSADIGRGLSHMFDRDVVSDKI